MFSAYNSVFKCLLFNLIDALFLPEVLKDVFLQDRRRLAPPEIPADEFVHLFAKKLIIFCAKMRKDVLFFLQGASFHGSISVLCCSMNKQRIGGK